MAFDGATGPLVLFGGGSCSGTCQLSDTWVWTGSDWEQLSPPTSPSARAGASMAFDPATGQLLLFGGDSCSLTCFLSDTWVWERPAKQAQSITFTALPDRTFGD